MAIAEILSIGSAFMESLLTAIVEDDRALVKKLLKADPTLSARLIEKAFLYQTSIFHWIYVGDCALHLAAAGYRVEIVRTLISAGSDPNSARNHRQGTPLHYAADGYLDCPSWDAKRQVKTIELLIASGAKVNLQDKNGATPLHRAVRARSAAAVEFLLKSGGDPLLRNQSGSTAFHLAVQNTGRGGSGTGAAKAAQKQIIDAFLALNVSTSIKDGKGKSVLECARSSYVLEMLS